VGNCGDDVPDAGGGDGVGPGTELVNGRTAMHRSLARLYYFMRRVTGKEAIELFLKISRFRHDVTDNPQRKFSLMKGVTTP
jgi:hypothetical protein